MLQPRAIDVTPLADYKVIVTFDTGEARIFDVMPYISGDWFGKLRNIEVFNTVRIAGNTIEWAGGQDIAPHELYDYSVPTQAAIR
ncbi:MAG: DUF2442 domain-containing protein [Oscillospiraceae bacterium]|nr:DUF2442 domain-containing protein [Oscillospiraceae bacterium]